MEDIFELGDADEPEKKNWIEVTLDCDDCENLINVRFLADDFERMNSTSMMKIKIDDKEVLFQADGHIEFVKKKRAT